jgi:two-component SAPR family response regulator
MFPPAPVIKTSIVNKTQTLFGKLYKYILAFLVIGILLLVLFLRKRNKSVAHPVAEKTAKDTHSTTTGQAMNIPDIYPERFVLKNEPAQPQKSCITLFGGFQSIDADGNDITSHFTPLIKELFLLILLNSLPGKKGISSQKLNEILWFDKSDKDARNNRAVNIARLKVILKKIGNIEISKETGYWKVEVLTEDVYIDVYEYYKIINNAQVNTDQIFRLLYIARNGSMLLNLDSDWMDEYKSEASNSIVDTLLHFAEKNMQTVEPGLLVHIADVILLFDTLNEESMILKCRTLAKLGKHSLAKNAYTKFCNEYKTLYDEAYLKNFNEIIE